MTTEHTGRNRKASPDQLRLDTIIYGSVCTLRESQAMAEELLHLRKRTGTLESQIDEWKAACGLDDAHGDPDGIEPRHLAERLRDLDRVRDALAELYECARLRGDNDLPCPSVDPKMWTARMQEAWTEAEYELDTVGAASDEQGTGCREKLRSCEQALDAERKVHASTALARDTAAAKVAVIERLDKWLNDDSQTLHAEITYEYASLHDEKRVLAIGLIPGIFDAIDAALREAGL